jgi:hypothetical protein
MNVGQWRSQGFISGSNLPKMIFKNANFSKKNGLFSTFGQFRRGRTKLKNSSKIDKFVKNCPSLSTTPLM